MKKVVEQTACDRCGTQIAEGDVKQTGPVDVDSDVEVDSPVLFTISGKIVASTKGVKNSEIDWVDGGHTVDRDTLRKVELHATRPQEFQSIG